ncbi:hypothetical protein GCM10007094_41210 [Pseudovibrio japonicus]|uniref:Uncharacterized protein n=1 Tax=Pseudovibrio japonicus TaxID=366534 RepID=A0ABQ3EMY0_9HYPH|nr:hypothetical protein [Pseudovibrio japonicus]GHB47680.1 hypothetical protein GCM10007094_41210 [Pseudovibrio japonicus]
MYIACYRDCVFGIGNSEEKALEKAREILSLLGREELEYAFYYLKTAPITERACAALKANEAIPFTLI